MKLFLTNRLFLSILVCAFSFFSISNLYGLTISMPSESSNTSDSQNNQGINSNSYFNNNVDLSNPIAITYLSYGNPQLDPFSPSSEINNYVAPVNVVLETIKDFLFYPNPFSLVNDHVQIGFQLSKDLEENSLEIQIYDMRGLHVFEGRFQDKILGKDYQKIDFSDSTFDKPIPTMSSGVYLYLLLFEGEILGKGKFVIKP
mgnify:CR=1 FL=1|tara:strand:- start:191 stop:793 length:603 start_codon:yes stop_codon:yes gene_type:complete